MSDDLFSAYAIYSNTHANLPKQDIRVPGLGECMLRALGFKRNEPFYGVDGDRIAARFPHRGWDWARHGYQEDEPFWITEGKQNEMSAHFILAFMAMNVAFAIYIIGEKTKPQEQSVAAPPAVRYAQPDKQQAAVSRVQFYVQR